MRHAATLRVPAQHPALAGHFPGNPVVPGVMLLEAVVSAAEAWLGTELRPQRLSHAKFLAPLKPEDTARIDLLFRPPRLEFAVCRGSTTIASGVLEFGGGRDR